MSSRTSLAQLAALTGAIATISVPASAEPKLELPIKNVIFDMGGVLVSLNNAAFRRRMGRLAGGSIEKPAFHALFVEFMTGKVSTRDFRASVRKLRPANRKLSDGQIDAAFTSQVGAANCKGLKIAMRLRRMGIKTYVLSTNNPLHAKLVERRFRACFKKQRGDVLKKLFVHIYYTHDLGLLKPDPAIFKRVCRHAKIRPRQTLFIDDTPINVLGAQKAGLYSLLVSVGSYESWLARLVSPR